MKTALVQCDVPADWATDFSQCLFEWQGLEAGVLALAAAFLGAWYIRKQITQSEKHVQDAIRRRHQAIRVTISHTLSGICRAARKTLTALGGFRRDNGGARALNRDPDLQLRLPEKVVASLQSFLETTDNSDLIKANYQLIIDLQVSQSRLEDIHTANDIEIDDRMIDVAQVHALSEALFDYARGESELPPHQVGWDRVTAALNLAGVRRARNPTVHERVARASESAADFWSAAQ